MNILTISGSQRADSFNTKVVRSLAGLVSEHTFTQLDYSDIPLYNQDLEASFPESVTKLKEQIEAAEAIIISTPEYNRSIPAPLKNLIDWTSRPWGQSSWNGKPVLVMGATIAPTGTTLAQADLRKVLLYVGAYVPGHSETYISSIQNLLDESGTWTDAATAEHLTKAITQFVQFVEKVS